MNIQGLTLTREQIQQYAKEPRTVRAIESVQADVVELGAAVSTAPFITLSNDPTLGAERALVLTGDLTAIDAGPNGNYTLGLSDTAVIPGTYGSASKTVSLIITASGRITGATEFALNTSNITEGSNLYFTNARARAALSAGAGITYNSSTGAISATSAGTYGTPTGTLSRATFASYTAPTISNPPTQAEVQAVANALQAVSQTLAALITDMEANGNLT